VAGAVGIIGAGTMGRGLAQALIQAGREVVLHDKDPKATAAAVAAIRERLEKFRFKSNLPPAKFEAILRRLKPTEALADFKPCSFIIEAVFEDLETKKEIACLLEYHASPECSLATNTSSLSVNAIAVSLRRPERFLGMHFFNPVPLMKLVEIIKGDRTSPEALEAARGIARDLEKTSVEVKDSPGFIVNRILRPYFLEPQRLIAEGLSTVEEVDAAMKWTGYPMGPFELMDFNGLEVNLTISQVIYRDLGRLPRLKPHALQEALVKTGCLGRKTGKGFYLYEGGKPIRANPRIVELCPAKSPESRLPKMTIARRILRQQIQEAEILAGSGLATAEDIDCAMRLGTNAPRGPFEWKELLDAKTSV